MYTDLDFNMTAAGICNLMTETQDIRLVLTAEKWLVRLLADGHGVNEYHYLKLLQCMMIYGQVKRPFLKPPPEGPLPPFSR